MTERIDIVVSETGARRVKRSLDDIGDSGDRAGKLIAKLQKGLLALGVGFALQQAISETIRFQSAIAEVSTLVDTATFDMKGLTAAALDNAAAFGQAPVEQAKAFYQIISAGATSAAQAQETLTAANRLAVGGVTDVATAADGLTSVLNAYGSRVQSAADVSDILFVGVRAGKTTVEELSNSLGKVAPIAAAAGVEFDQLVASVAALTKGGISTREAVTGVRGILAAVVKPSQEAEEAAKRLGIQFNAAGLEALGFQGFLNQVVQKTGGSTSELAQLFGGVEALVPILALAGQAGVDFADIIEQMGDRAGVTEEAFNKIANSPGFQIQRLLAGIQAEAIKVTSQFTTALVPVIRFLADNLDTLSRIVQALGIALGVYLALQVIPLTIRALGLLFAVIAANPIGALVTAITIAASAFVTFSDKLRFSAEGSATVFDFLIELFVTFRDVVRDGLNFLIGLFPTFEAELKLLSPRDLVINFGRGLDRIRNIFTSTFAFIETLVINSLNRIGQVISDTLNGGIQLAENFVTGLNVIGRRLQGKDLDPSVLADFGIDFTPRFAEAGQTAAEAYAETFKAGLNDTTFEDAFTAFADRVEARGAARLAESATTPVIPTLTDAPGRSGSLAPDKSIIELQKLQDAIRAENELLKLNSDERTIRRGLLAIEEQIERKLTDTERDLTQGLLEQNLVLERQASLVDSIIAPQKTLTDRQKDLAAVFEQGRITANEYNLALEDLAIAQAALNASGSSGTFVDGLIGSLDRARGAFGSFAAQLGDVFGTTFDQIGQGFAQTIGQGIFDVDNLGESFKALGRNIISGLVTSLIQVGVQQAANFALTSTLGAAATAQGAAQAAALATAYAPAAAAASLATAGANAVPAGIGIGTIFALLAGLVGGAALAGFADGTDFVGGPGTGRSDSILARLSRGEGVVTAQANAANPGAVAAMNAGARVGGTVVNNYNFPPGTDVEAFRKSRRQLNREARTSIESA